MSTSPPGTSTPPVTPQPPKTGYDVLILGGGISGLAAASFLTQKGYKTLVVEARGRLGGRIHTVEIGEDGGRVALGAATVHGKYGNRLYDLMKEIGLPIHYDGADQKLVIVDENGRVDSGKAEELVEAVADTWFTHARHHALTTSPPPTYSLGDFFASPSSALQSRPWSPLDAFRLRTLFKAFSAWAGVRPEKVSLKWWGFERETMGPDGIVHNGGYGMVVDHLKELGGEVLLNCKVDGIRYDEGRGLVTVSVDNPSNATAAFTVSAPHVICTLPLGVLQNDPPTFDPPLVPRKARAIKALGFGILNKILLKYDTAWWIDADTAPDFAICPMPEDPHALAPPGLEQERTEPQALLVDNYKVIDGSNMLVLFMDLDYAYSMEDSDPKTMTAWAHSIVSRYLRPPGMSLSAVPQPVKDGALSTAWSKDPFAFGSYTHIPVGYAADGLEVSPLDMKEFEVPMWDGALGFAGEHTVMDMYASVHGAYESGLREAKRVDFEKILQKTGEEWEY